MVVALLNFPLLESWAWNLIALLNFIGHISSQLRKGCAKTGTLRRITHFVPALWTLCQHYIHFLHFTTSTICSPLLLRVGKVQTNKIEDANHYFLRTLTGHGKSLSYQELLNICKLDTSECRKKQQSLILLFKCIRNIARAEVHQRLFQHKRNVLQFKRNVNLCVPKFNLNFMRNSFTYKCAQLWKKLPEDVKLADNVNIFKSKLRSTQL